MRKINKVFCIVVMLLGIVINLGSTESEQIPAEGEIIVNKEGYKLTEVLSIPWGDGENEITMGSEGEYKWGPQSFVVDNIGNIYFDDPGKRRIVKYTKDGELLYLKKLRGKILIGVDNEGNMFTKKGGGFYIYNSKGDLSEKIRFGKTEASIYRINSDKNKNLFLFYGRGYHTIDISEKTDKWGFKEGKLSKGKNGYPSKFMDVDYLIPEATETAKVIELERQEKTKEEINIKKAIEIVEYHIENFRIIGEDDKKDIYCLANLEIPSSYYPKIGFCALLKYSRKGEVLLTVRVFSNWTGIDMRVFTFDVTDNGDVYQLYSRSDGIRVVKWGK